MGGGAGVKNLLNAHPSLNFKFAANYLSCCVTKPTMLWLWPGKISQDIFVVCLMGQLATGLNFLHTDINIEDLMDSYGAKLSPWLPSLIRVFPEVQIVGCHIEAHFLS